MQPVFLSLPILIATGALALGATAEPAAQPNGTLIEVRDLFYATPARLKFLKKERAEYAAVKDVITRLAMGFPEVAFRLTHNGKVSLNLPAAVNAITAQSSATTPGVA